MRIKLRQQAVFNPRHSMQLYLPRPFKSCLYQDLSPGVMQTERVSVHSQTLSIIAAFIFGFLLRFPHYFAKSKTFSQARFTILALTLACSDCPMSKSNTLNHLLTLALPFLTQYRH